MKKAKIMLTAITVLAVVGGAVAFKAKSAYTTHTFYSLNDDGTACDKSFSLSSTTDPINTTDAPLGVFTEPAPTESCTYLLIPDA